MITKVIKNKCNSDSKTNICNNYYSTSSDSVCLWKKKSQSAPRGTKQLNFCWETEHKAINIWLVALILNNCVKAIRAICRGLNKSNVGLESHYQTGMGWRWDCVKKCLLNTLPDYVSIQGNRCPNGETLHYGNLDQDQASLKMFLGRGVKTCE